MHTLEVINIIEILFLGMAFKKEIRMKVLAKFAIENVDSLASIMALGGAEINMKGELVIKQPKGFLKKKYEKYVVDYGTIKGGSKVVIFFRLADSFEPFMNIDLLKDNKGNLILKVKCRDNSLKSLCKSITETFKRGIMKYRESPATLTKKEGRKFTVSRSFEKVLDGFAEVTLSKALLKYPLVWVTKVKARDLMDLNFLLEGILKRFGPKKYIIEASAGDWRFIIAFEGDKGEFTPSFISWRTDERYVGSDAMKRLRKVNPEASVDLIVLEMNEHH